MAKLKKCTKCPLKITTHPPARARHMIAAHGAVAKNGNGKKKRAPAKRRATVAVAAVAPKTTTQPAVPKEKVLAKDLSDGALVEQTLRRKARQLREKAALLDKTADEVKDLF